MPFIGSGRLGGIRGGKKITLNDENGVDEFVVTDKHGFPVFKVDSKGVVKMKGTSIQKL